MNSDYPRHKKSSAPLSFPPASFGKCKRITSRILSSHCQVGNGTSSNTHDTVLAESILVPIVTLDEPVQQKAYWLLRTLRDTPYGRITFAKELRRIKMPCVDSTFPEWEATDKSCAIKEMDWEAMQEKRDKLVEDPITEVDALQYLKEKSSHDKVCSNRHVLLPMKLLSDDHRLYSILPFCDGGELSNLFLDSRLLEENARIWMKQILQGIAFLQSAGVCHRDISLDNILVLNNKCVIIDFGMCLLVPFLPPEDPPDLADEEPYLPLPLPSLKPNPVSFDEFDMEIDSSDINDSLHTVPSKRKSPSLSACPIVHGDTTQSRMLIKPQHRCGKLHYMSPEVYRSTCPFDGFATDMWSTGVVLFIMVAGFPPWEFPCDTDERFKHMSRGKLAQILVQWDVGLSLNLMDLLQKMLYRDPKKRFCLDQVLKHPWMTAVK